MQGVNPTTFAISYVLQLFGFLGIAFAWGKAVVEYRHGKKVYRTRILMLIITTIALMAYVVPSMIAVCYFVKGCFQPIYRDYLRIFSGAILFLYGLFKFLLYYTKDVDI
jgi:hypothetical protein